MKCSEENAKFLIEHPDHIPLLDGSGNVIGIMSPIYELPLCACCNNVIWAGESVVDSAIGRCHSDCYKSSLI